MDATLPNETDEGCRLDAQESQQRNTELFSYAPDERDLRRNQRDDSSSEAQGKRFSYLCSLCRNDLLGCRKIEISYTCSENNFSTSFGVEPKYVLFPSGAPVWSRMDGRTERESPCRCTQDALSNVAAGYGFRTSFHVQSPSCDIYNILSRTMDDGQYAALWSGYDFYWKSLYGVWI